MQLSSALMAIGICLVGGALLAGCVPKSSVSVTPRSTVPVLINQKKYQIELAQTPAEQQQGLSGRKELGSDGMLFIFSSPGTYGFWMKEMQFDLDFVWIRAGKVVEVTKKAVKPTPQQTTAQLQTYFPSQPVDMMLEVTAGFADVEHIVVGSTVEVLEKR